MTYRCEETLRTLVHALAHRSHFKTKLEPTRCPLAQCSLSRDLLSQRMFPAQIKARALAAPVFSTLHVRPVPRSLFIAN